MPDFASELAELRRSTGSPAALAAALPDRRHSGADRVALSPAYPDLGASLDSLTQINRTR